MSASRNFDDLLVPKDHVSRSKSDTFYIDNETVLRTHTSAHQTELIQEGHDRFLCTGDVYRRDTVDASHYPVFHQMEGVRVFKHDEIDPRQNRESAVEMVSEHLQSKLETMVRSVLEAWRFDGLTRTFLSQIRPMKWKSIFKTSGWKSWVVV